VCLTLPQISLNNVLTSQQPYCSSSCMDGRDMYILCKHMTMRKLKFKMSIYFFIEFSVY